MKTRNRLLSTFLIGVIYISAISALDQPVVAPVNPAASKPGAVLTQSRPGTAQPNPSAVHPMPGSSSEKSVATPANRDSTPENPVGAPNQHVNTTKHPQEHSVMTPAEALQSLKDGNKRFITDHLEKAAGKEQLIELAKGQKPIAAVIACADSRVTPELIFNKGLGELFVLRVAGNVAVEAYALAGSAEYAVAHLHVPLIVVIGHETCGAVKATLKGDPEKGNLGRLLKAVQVGNHLNLVAAVRNNVIFQADQLLLESELIRDFVVSERIIVVPAVFSFNTGEVTFMDPVVWEKE
jgi:carbonic anhydrase